MNQLDLTIQSHFPCHVLPKFEVFEPMTKTGDRLLLGSSKLQMEISRPWLHAIVTISGEEFSRGLPYGEPLVERREMRCGEIPRALMLEFMEKAAAACPNEVGAWIVWDEHSNEFSLIDLPILTHSPDHLAYQAPILQTGQWLVIDLHSHGPSEAFFSVTDDADDKGSVKMSFVLGKCDGEFEWAARWNLLGVQAPMEVRKFGAVMRTLYSQRIRLNETSSV